MATNWPLGMRMLRTRPTLAQQINTSPTLEQLEEVILWKVCTCGGRLSLTALNESLIQDRIIGPNSSESALRRFLVTRSPHNVRLFQLDEDPRRSDCTVRVKTDVVLCRSFNPRHGTCSGYCSALHLCRHFVANKCKNGPRCNWPHELRGSSHNLAVLNQSGLACLDDAHIIQILRQSWLEYTVPDVCKHYNGPGGCTKDDCRFLHVCRHYIIGDCKFQVCRRSHNVKDRQPMQVWKMYNIEAQANSPVDLLNLLREKKKQEELSDSSDNADNTESSSEKEDDDEEEEEEETLFEVNQSSQDVPDVCVHYNTKTCKNGEQCTFLHVCRFFILGNCKFSNGCRLSHDIKSSQVTNALQKRGIQVSQIPSDELVARIRDQKQRLSQKKRSTRQESSESRHSSSGDAGSLDKTEICEYNLRGKCLFKDGCRKLHTEQHFQWQFQENDQRWTNFTKANVAIEKRFCNVSKEMVNLTASDSSLSFINFTSKKWILTKLGSEHRYDVRRLETPAAKSSDDSSWRRIWCTTWQWFFQDNGDIWVQYAKDAEIEEAYQTYLTTGQGANFEFETEHFRYVLDFSCMTQKNKRTSKTRKVRRRPQFVTKDALQRNLKQMKVAAVVLPKTWDLHSLPMDVDTDFVLCKLNSQHHKEEFQLVSQRFGEKMDARTILSIERVQNNDLWHEFMIKREKMQSRQADSSKDPKEELLFHGTEERVVKAICQQNFDFRISGSRVGTKYGQGSYFSKSAKYSDHYASPDGSGRQRMFLARVLAGSYTVGQSVYRRPPLKDPTRLDGPLFDSCVDNTVDPLIFVIFDRGQVYPEYLITYKK